MVRSLIVMAMFAASLADAAWHDYKEQRDLNLDAAGITTVDVEAGAGSLEISGASGSGVIAVEATIEVPDRDDDKARKIIESRLQLTLDRHGDKAVLKAYFDRNFLSMDDEPRGHLVVRVPRDVNLVIDDASGSMSVSDVSGSVDIDDGSGSIGVQDVLRDVTIIDAGSGGVRIKDVQGKVETDT